MRWLAFGTYDVARHPRVGVLVEGLRASGDEVVEVNVPLDLDTAARVAMLRQPWRLPVLAAKVARCWTLLTLRTRHLRRGGHGRRVDGACRVDGECQVDGACRVDGECQVDSTGFDAVLVGYLGHFDVRLARRLFPRTLIVLDHLVSAAGTAADRRLVGRDGVKARLMRGIDAGALRCADVVLVDTDEHAAALAPAGAGTALVVPVGASADWFAVGAGATRVHAAGAAATRVHAAGAPAVSTAEAGEFRRPPLRVIFVGVFTPLHGAATLGEAMAALASDDRVEFTMVGTGQDYAQCRRLATANTNVTWVDWVGAADLPALVAAHDVSLGIFGTTAKAQVVVPNKVYQGAAAGCAVVTSDTPSQRAALGDNAFYVPAGDSAALASALRDLAGDPARLAKLRAQAAARAQRFTAASVVAPLRDVVATAARPDPRVIGPDRD